MENNDKKPDYSVIIGLVSTEDNDRILETLDSLKNQDGDFTYEVILADRRNDEITKRIALEYPEAELIHCQSSTSLPELRTMALEKSSGKYILVTEDHCVPAHDWFQTIDQAFRESPDGTVAVGGCVENGVKESALDWATFLTEYSFFLKPVQEGSDNPSLPGMNVAYHKSIFENLDKKLLTSGFWETTVHPELIKQGKKLYSTNNITMYHCKKFSFGLFARQRFIYSRYYAGLRYDRSQLLKRMIAFGATFILPPLLFYRMIKQFRAKKRADVDYMSATPYLFLFVFVWAWGEMYGYVFGTGDALNKIE